MEIKISIIYPADPFGQKIGGEETFIKGLIKFAPNDFKIEFIGIASDAKERPVKQWKKLKLSKREFNFLPLFFEKDENKKTLVSLSFRFTLALGFSKIIINKDILFLIEWSLLYYSEKLEFLR